MSLRLPLSRHCLALAAAGALAAPLHAQFVRAAHRGWQTRETARFVVHHAPEARAWVDSVAPRLDAIHDAVAAVVGVAPPGRVTLLVDDPQASQSAFASGNLKGPVISMWPDPGDPRVGLSAPRVATLAHELTHLFQGAARDEAPWLRAAWAALPAELGPVLRRAPRWAKEGYATHVAGRVTDASQPASAYRAALLRSRALDGGWPAYDALDATDDAAYQVASAFFDWLSAQRGERAVADLWRAMARGATLDAAFAAGLGAGPRELYARFSDDVMRKAREAARAVDAAGRVEGTLLRRFEAYTEDVALSRDGALVAILDRAGLPNVVVARADDPTHPVARLPYFTGRPRPRFLADGKRLLVTSWEPIGEGGQHPDLFLWDFTTGDFRRVTRGAGVQDADPAPDMRTAAGTRCLYGVCDLVRVELASGRVATLVRGTPSRAFTRPRWSPDGTRLVATMQSGAAARVVLVDPATGAVTPADPDDGARRYEPAFLPDGRRVAAVSEAGGVPNLEAIDLETRRATPLGRVVTAAFAPEPHPRDGSVLYLRYRSGALDLYRLPADAPPVARPLALDPALFPAAPPARRDLPPLAATTPTEARPYALGPRFLSALPRLAWSAEGGAAGLALWTSDPIGRLSGWAQGIAGTGAAWRGGSANVVWRGLAPTLGADVFVARHRPSARDDALPDAGLRGAAAHAAWARASSSGNRALRATLAAGDVSLDGGARRPRRLLGARYAMDRYQTGQRAFAVHDVALEATAGRTADSGWARGVVRYGVQVGRTGSATLARAAVTAGAVRGLRGGGDGGVPAFERFSLGGAAPALVDAALLGQRAYLPALRPRAADGRGVLVAEARLPATPWVTPYAWAGRTSSRDGWVSVVGVERALVDMGARRAWRVPGVRIDGGLGYTVAGARGGRLAGWAGIAYTQ